MSTGFDKCISVAFLYFLSSLSFFWLQMLDFLLFMDALSLQSVIWSLTITASSGMSLCMHLHFCSLLWLFLFLFRMCVGLQWSLSSRARRRHQTPRRPVKHRRLFSPREPFFSTRPLASLSSVFPHIE